MTSVYEKSTTSEPDLADIRTGCGYMTVVPISPKDRADFETEYVRGQVVVLKCALFALAIILIIQWLSF
jgi:hypothetical protein